MVFRVNELPGAGSDSRSAPKYEATYEINASLKISVLEFEQLISHEVVPGHSDDLRVSAESLRAETGGLRSDGIDDEHESPRRFSKESQITRF